MAERAGAVGVILYNDPMDSVDLATKNATSEDTFPNSWYLPPSGVERGSVMEFSGDPLTPGFPSKGTCRHNSTPRLNITANASLRHNVATDDFCTHYLLLITTKPSLVTRLKKVAASQG